MAVSTVVLCLVVTMRSTSILNLIINFGALMMVGQIDDATFSYFAKKDYFGQEIYKTSKAVLEKSVQQKAIAPQSFLVLQTTLGEGARKDYTHLGT